MKLFDPALTPEEQEFAWYVDREQVLRDIAERLRWNPDAVSRVAVYHGPGGIGKTALRKMAEKLVLQPANVPYAVIDYEPDGSPRSCEQTFSYMRRQLARFGLKFPAFDLVWARYWEETTHQRVSKSSFPPEIEDAADIVTIIPILGNIPQAIVACAKLSQAAAHWLSQLSDRETIAQLQEMDAMKLRRIMPEAMARDLEEMTEDRHRRGKDGGFRITVVFDGFERLDEHGVDDWFVSEFCCATGSVFKVIFGREPVRWERCQSAWRRFVDHYPPIANLRPPEATEYLERRGIHHSELRDYLVKLTDGFPYHLRLAADLCQQIKETTGKEPKPADFATAAQAVDLGTALLELLLRQIRKDELDAVARLASIPRWFTEDILEALLAEPASTPSVFPRLVCFSFCEPVPALQGAYMVRKEARKLLRSQARNLSHWLFWNRKLRDYHAQHRTERSHLVEELYHGLIVDPDETLKVFRVEFFRALNTWRFGDCWTLLQAVPSELELPRAITQWLTLARVALLQEAWESKEGLVAAKTLVESLVEQELSPNLRGRTLRLAAMVNIKLGDRTEALNELQKAIDTFDSLGDWVMKARTLRDLGDLYFTMGNLHDALKSHKQALNVLKRIRSGSLSRAASEETQVEAEAGIAGLPLGHSLRAVASLYARTGRTESAVE
ncbi:MAG: tetratricopeptide repeat protein, partial [Chloroflexi bacterium]|nr:tetratricopeptide repeat protein [Chloroflexota bacterium]